MKNPFSKSFWGTLLSAVWSAAKGEKEKVLRDIGTLAPLAFEAATKRDINGDGKVPAIKDVARLALANSEGWGRDLIEAAIKQVGVQTIDFDAAIQAVLFFAPRADWLQWFTIAHISDALATRASNPIAPSAQPALSDFRGVVNAVYKIG